MEKENINVTGENENTEYVPRNAVVAAKEKLYDRTNLTVGQVDKFIIGCVCIILALVWFGVTH